MNIVTALEALAVEGIEGDHDHIIETVLSKLFVRGNEVHKAYKHRVGDFADLTDKETRRQYIAEDFFWNNKMAPEIYLELRHVQRDGERFVHVDEGDGEDWYIVMKKIDTSRDLMRVLEKGSQNHAELSKYAHVLKERLALLTKDRRGDLEHFFSDSSAHVRSEIMAVFGWAYTATPILSTEEIAYAEKLIERALLNHPYWQNHIHTVSVIIDNNSENILFLDEGVSFIDVMPPKDAWRVHDRYFSLCRTSADISALVGTEHAEILHQAYANGDELPQEIVRVVYEIAASLIQVPYRKMVGRDDLSAKYADFIRTRTKDLELLLENFR